MHPDSWLRRLLGPIFVPIALVAGMIAPLSYHSTSLPPPTNAYENVPSTSSTSNASAPDVLFVPGGEPQAIGLNDSAAADGVVREVQRMLAADWGFGALQMDLAVAHADPPDRPAYTVSAPAGVNVRSGPGTQFDLVDHLPYGTPLPIICQDWGSDVRGSKVWNKISDNPDRWVSDYWSSTPLYARFSPGLQQCSGSTAPAPPNRQTRPANTFPAGQCTQYALERARQIAGVYPAINGPGADAWTWAGKAQAAGWTVDTTPAPASIVVFQRGFRGADSDFGHVAIIERAEGGRWLISESNFLHELAPDTRLISLTPGEPGIQYIHLDR